MSAALDRDVKRMRETLVFLRGRASFRRVGHTAVVELLTDPAALARSVAERIDAYKVARRGLPPGTWRVECGPRYWRHLRKFELARIPGWSVTASARACAKCASRRLQIAAAGDVMCIDCGHESDEWSLPAGGPVVTVWNVAVVEVDGPEGWRLLEVPAGMTRP